MTIKMYDLAGAQENRRFSPYCWRIKMALAHKGLEVETIPWRFTEKEAIAFSGQGKVPVIVDGENTVFDSWNIANYLEDKYTKSPSLFGCSQAQANALFIKHWDEKVLIPILLPLLVTDILAHIHEKDQNYVRGMFEERLGRSPEDIAKTPEEQLPKLHSSLGPLRETLRSQSFLAGKQPNFSDYIVFARLHWGRCISPIKLLETDDLVYAWRERMLDLYDGLARKSLGYDV
ncbi:glutathione S-transferase N-terminal domain-containing protein [Lyngbya aestuarii]|uniref:glutathione S-transferase N-terminal domain-containing protein n=1 Tax=Lyngbya aestuarii TaxID=118322 RepID=UPI00403DCBAE